MLKAKNCNPISYNDDVYVTSQKGMDQMEEKLLLRQVSGTRVQTLHETKKEVIISEEEDCILWKFHIPHFTKPLRKPAVSWHFVKVTARL